MSSERQLNGGEVLVETLAERGVDTVLFVPGGTYTTVLEALSRRTNAIRSVPTRLESAAVFAAEAYSAFRRKPACIFVSRAPGATNAAIGIHTAMQASRPVVLFIANIPKPLKGTEAFQEIEYLQMYTPIAKAVLDVHSYEEIAPVTARALDLSMTGRPGPVVVSVSKDLLDGPTGDPPIPPALAAPRAGPEPDALARLANLLETASRPILLAGEMVAFEAEHARLLTLAARTGAGVVAAYRQQDVFPNSHPAWLGHLTLNRLPHIERALDEADLLVAIGSRMDSVTTNDYSMLREGQTLAMVYPEPTAFAPWQPEVALVSHAGPAMQALIDRLGNGDAPAERVAWRDAIHRVEAEFSSPGEVEAIGDVDMGQVIAKFRARVPTDTVVVSDAGTFGRWLHRYCPFDAPDTSLGPVSGAMGYGLPGAIGAALAADGRAVFAWLGDGGFLMTGHELATLVQDRVPVKVVVCDNSAWGSILVHQNKRFPGWDYGTRLTNPDFTAMGNAYGIASFRVERTDDFDAALDGALDTDGPALIHLVLDPRDVSPYSGSAR